MYRTLLVPLDGSPFGEQALPLAAEIARRARAALHLVHVHTVALPIYVEGLAVVDPELHSRAREHERSYLEQIARRLTEELDQPITIAVLNGPVAPALIRYAETHHIDLAIMTTHGRGGLARAWLGSTADSLIHHSALPLLLLRPSAEPATPRLPTLERMLIPLDGSPLAEQILTPALALGTLLGARYTLAQVIEPFEFHGLTPGIDREAVERAVMQERLSAASAYLQRVAETLRAEGHTVAIETLEAHRPAVALIEALDNHDLIALATHGSGGLTRLLLGSVADKIVRGAERPILLYRPPTAASA